MGENTIGNRLLISQQSAQTKPEVLVHRIVRASGFRNI